jgi:hypothetical protein
LQEHQERTTKVERDFLNKEQRLQKNLRETLEKMISDQVEEIKVMQQEFGNASAHMD